MFSSQTCERSHLASLLAGGSKQREKKTLLGPLSVSLRVFFPFFLPHASHISLHASLHIDVFACVSAHVHTRTRKRARNPRPVLCNNHQHDMGWISQGKKAAETRTRSLNKNLFSSIKIKKNEKAADICWEGGGGAREGRLEWRKQRVLN